MKMKSSFTNHYLESCLLMNYLNKSPLECSLGYRIFISYKLFVGTCSQTPFMQCCKESILLYILLKLVILT